MALTRKVDEVEARILGALMEKEKATPDAYPLSVNALISACNQRSNREPVMELSSEQVVDALDRLRRDVLVWRSTGARVEKWEHRLQSRWKLEAPGQAIMTLLLLRGAQTPGELRSRSERLHAFDDVGEVLDVLGTLAAGNDPLVRELPREPGQRETRWRHVMGEGAEDPAPATATASAAPTTLSGRNAVAVGDVDEGEGDDLEQRLAELEERVDDLSRRLRQLERELT